MSGSQDFYKCHVDEADGMETNSQEAFPSFLSPIHVCHVSGSPADLTYDLTFVPELSILFMMNWDWPAVPRTTQNYYDFWALVYSEKYK